jgi:hypothetical protein
MLLLRQKLSLMNFPSAYPRIGFDNAVNELVPLTVQLLAVALYFLNLQVTHEASFKAEKAVLIKGNT